MADPFEQVESEGAVLAEPSFAVHEQASVWEGVSGGHIGAGAVLLQVVVVVALGAQPGCVPDFAGVVDSQAAPILLEDVSVPAGLARLIGVVVEEAAFDGVDDAELVSDDTLSFKEVVAVVAALAGSCCVVPGFAFVADGVAVAVLLMDESEGALIAGVGLAVEGLTSEDCVLAGRAAPHSTFPILKSVSLIAGSAVSAVGFIIPICAMVAHGSTHTIDFDGSVGALITCVCFIVKCVTVWFSVEIPSKGAKGLNGAKAEDEEEDYNLGLVHSVASLLI